MNAQLSTRLRHLRLSGMVEALPARVAQAEAAHDSPGYQQALKVLGKAVDRDLRIVEGV